MLDNLEMVPKEVKGDVMANASTEQTHPDGAACLATSPADMPCQGAALGNGLQELTAAVIIIQNSAK